jgi:protein-tyrosine-phosphatase
MPQTKSILFICVQNSARSQIAEGFFKKYANERIACSSAGTVPAERINPDAIVVMKEVGIDITANKPKVLTNQMIQRSTVIINMGCMDSDSCPATLLRGKEMEDWSIEDAAGKSIATMREIRNEIERKVMDLIRRLSED